MLWWLTNQVGCWWQGSAVSGNDRGIHDKLLQAHRAVARVQRRDSQAESAAFGTQQTQVRSLADSESAGLRCHAGILLAQQGERVARAEEGPPVPGIAQAGSVVAVHVRQEVRNRQLNAAAPAVDCDTDARGKGDAHAVHGCSQSGLLLCAAVCGDIKKL